MQNEENNKYLIPLAIVVAGVLVAGAIYFGDAKPTADNPQPTTQNNTEAEIIPLNDKDHILGDKNAPIVIIEYSDLECPFCKIFHETMKQVIKDYDGKVAWVYRHFPIPELHSKAIREAVATECAAELGGNEMFWQYTDRIYEITNSNNSLDLAQLPKIAKDLGLNVEAFNQCLESDKYTTAIENSMKEAVQAGAQGTPFSLILKGNKKITINGAEPITMVKAKINALLNEN